MDILGSREVIMKQPELYEINFDKVNSINDVIDILKCLDIKVYDNYKNFDQMKSYLKKTEEK